IGNFWLNNFIHKSRASFVPSLAAVLFRQPARIPRQRDKPLVVVHIVLTLMKDPLSSTRQTWGQMLAVVAVSLNGVSFGAVCQLFNVNLCRLRKRQVQTKFLAQIIT